MEMFTHKYTVHGVMLAKLPSVLVELYKRTKNLNIYCFPCPKKAKKKLNRNNKDVQEQDSALYSLQVHLCNDNLTLINIKPICLIL